MCALPVDGSLDHRGTLPQHEKRKRKGRVLSLARLVPGRKSDMNETSLALCFAFNPAGRVVLDFSVPQRVDPIKKDGFVLHHS
jgi:hypothetical protein